MKNRSVYRSLTMISQFGINMVVPIFGCTFAGMFVDNLLHTSFFVILCFFMGALAGFRNIYILATKVMNYSEKEESRNARKHQKQPENK